jgi:hypothetical protein
MQFAEPRLHHTAQLGAFVPKLSLFVIAVCALLATATSSFAVTPVPTYSVPEPATGALIVSGIAGWLIARRRKRKK